MAARQTSELDAAIARVKAEPDNQDAWDEVESLAGTLDSPDEVAEAYRSVLSGKIKPALAVELGQRAARFHEEWFGPDSAGLAEILERVLAIEPSSEWAFQRLTVVLTVGERWSDLLSLYDRAIASETRDERKVQLLDEAYQSAKDLAGAPERAIGYLQQRLAIKADRRLADALERLLEKYERWRDLIDLWGSRLGDLDTSERATTRLRIAETWLEKIGDPGQALEAARALLGELEVGNDKSALELLERVLTRQGASREVRDGALSLLRDRYQAAERPREVIRVLDAAIALADGDASKTLRSEVARRLGDLEDHDAAITHYATLLGMDPGSTTTQKALRAAAQAANKLDRYAAALSDAAARCEDPTRKVALLSDAARTRLDMLDDEAAAIELYLECLRVDGIAAGDTLAVGRRLNQLLDRAGRSAERLDVLERLAQAETVNSSRRGLIGDIGTLAEELGETDRALAAWRKRLRDDAADLTALAAVIGLLEREQRWDELITALRQRAAVVAPTQKRADLVRIARTFEGPLKAPDRAVEAWLQVVSDFGEDAESVEALASLYTATERWSDLAELLERANKRQTERLGERLARLGDAYRGHLDSARGALDCYQRCLAIDPRHQEARRGLVSLLQEPECRAAAADALARAYRETEEWGGFLELVDPRLEETEDPGARLEILREAAEIREKHGSDPETALALFCRCFPLAPEDRGLEERILRLARRVGRWDQVIGAYRGAVAAIGDTDPRAAARLCFREAGILENELEDAAGALAAFLAVIAVEPHHLPATAAVVRIGSALGRWTEVAKAVSSYAHATERVEESLLGEMETAAQAGNAFDPLCQALAQAIDGTPLTRHEEAELSWWLAGWHRDHRKDLDAAQMWLRRVVDKEPHREKAVRALVELERRQPGIDLFQTVRRLCDLAPQDLDAFREAAELAVQHADDVEMRRASLTALFNRASGAWRKTAPMKGNADPQECVSWVVERLVDSYCGTGDHRAALDLLMDASRLPFPAEVRRAMRLRAAGIASETGDTASAIEMYRAVLMRAPDDAEAIEKLAALYRAQERYPEMLALRRHELGLEPPRERRIDLRLELVQILAEIERRGGRIEVLRANLTEQPGHPASVSSLIEVLTAHGQHHELCELLSDQARQLETLGDGDRAAQLWSTAARIAEERAGDAERALDAYRRVVALHPSKDALDALARLCTEAKRHGEAVPWLEQRLAGAEPAERAPVVMRLARAHLGAAQPDRAISCLEGALTGRYATLEVRRLLADLYRENEAWEPLAALLTDSLALLTDAESQMQWAREAADIYHDKLQAPAKAIPALEKALSYYPDDRRLRLMLAVGQRVAGNLDQARTLLEGLIAEFGRRRSAERAAIHVELAQVARAQNQLAAAVEELDLASRMDVSNPHIMKSLAEMARESGNIEQAEKSLRALLLLVRREPPGDDENAIGTSEVLYELSLIAVARDDKEKATELHESAIEAAGQSDAEARRFRRTLLQHNQADLLLRVLRGRLEASDSPTSKARLLCDVAEVLERESKRPDEALRARLDAISLAPGDDENHRRARQLAVASDRVEDYMERVGEVADGLRRDEEAQLAGTLLMRLGKVAEEDLKDLERARDYYERACKLGSQEVEALFAMARASGAAGDSATQKKVLEQLTQVALEETKPAARAVALYRLAEVELTASEFIAQGVSTLSKAIEAEPRYREAATILQKAADARPDEKVVLGLYEKVARASHDPELLLDFLERRARLADATPAQVREAVDLAAEVGRPERGELLLERAVQAAQRSEEGLVSALWAATSLIRIRITANDLAGAYELFTEVSELCDQETVLSLGTELAKKAARAQETLALAADAYEFLRARDPQNRAVWEPLFAIYRQLGDTDRLHQMVMTTLPGLMDLADRNHMRRHAAAFFADQGKVDDAVDLLRNALLDDADDNEAAVALEKIFRDRDDHEALADFLGQRFDDAMGRKNPVTVAAVAVQLGTLLEEVGSGDALSVYREALTVAPDDPQLLRAAIKLTDQEREGGKRAALMERLLHVEDEAAVPPLALSLADLWAFMGEIEGVRRALESGHARNPSDKNLRVRLEDFYRDQELWRPLSELMVRQAQDLETRAAVARYRDAATICRENLKDLDAAAKVLARARSADPKNDSLVMELASCLTAAGQTAAAVSTLSAALDNDVEGNPRLHLLLLRSDLRFELGDAEAAVADLEEAYKIDTEVAQPLLLRGLERRRQVANQQGDSDTERELTLRLADLLVEADQSEPARDLLLRWIERAPQDREALFRVRDMDTKAGRWDGVLAACSRLALIEEGDDQVDAALRVFRAAEKLGAPEAARNILEHVFRIQPERAVIREFLRHVYNGVGARAELAQLLLAEAQYADDEETRYCSYRAAADIYVNELGDPEAALPAAKNAQEIRPHDHETVILLVDIMTASGKIEDAAAMLEPAISGHKRRSPELATLQHRMARIHASMGDRDNQLHWLKKAFDVDRKDAVIAAELAQLATEIGDYDLALKPLRAITLMDSPGPVTRVMALLWEAKIEHARGNRAKAELWAKKALREGIRRYSEARSRSYNAISE